MAEPGDVEVVKIEGELAIALSRADAFVCLAPFQERAFRPLLERLNAETQRTGVPGSIIAQVWDDTAGHIFVAAHVLSGSTAKVLQEALLKAKGDGR